jgi:hypothetical protein
VLLDSVTFVYKSMCTTTFATHLGQEGLDAIVRVRVFCLAQ